MMEALEAATGSKRESREPWKTDIALSADAELLDRFIATRDEAAFERLLLRHGPMVLGVCRRILHNISDAEDAFQATFLVLVYKAASIRPRGMVGNWLYGVARNTAIKARAMSAKRLAKENEAAKRSVKPAEPDWQDIQPILDEELAALSDKYRAAVILCDIEGCSLKDAAHHLGCPLATVGTRLVRGRALLARRLSRRGVVLTIAGLALLLRNNAASAAVPFQLANSTLRAASTLKAGNAFAAATAVPTRVSALTAVAMKVLLLSRLRLSLAVLVVISSVAFAGASVVNRARSGDWPFGARDTASDLRRLRGEWLLVSLQVGGKDIAKSEFKDYEEWKFDGDKFLVATPANVDGRFRIDATQRPKEIDLYSVTSNRPTNLPIINGPGIYVLSKGMLTICLPGVDSISPSRPADFVSSASPINTSVLVFQRKHSGQCRSGS
jgi:RNA polymerase sigma factor (sigma-70 family)